MSSQKKYFGPFSGAQLTAIVCAAILAPTAVYAVTYTYNVLYDPANGRTAVVDAGGRLWVYDYIAGYANNPAYMTEISGYWATSGSTGAVYTVPAGQAFIVKSINMSAYNGIAGNDNYTYFDGPKGFIGGFDDVNASSAHVATLGNGYYLHAGDTITVESGNGGTTTFDTVYSIEGYLVPAATVPPSTAQQMIQVGTSKKK